MDQREREREREMGKSRRRRVGARSLFQDDLRPLLLRASFRFDLRARIPARGMRYRGDSLADAESRGDVGIGIGIETFRGARSFFIGGWRRANPRIVLAADRRMLVKSISPLQGFLRRRYRGTCILKENYPCAAWMALNAIRAGVIARA